MTSPSRRRHNALCLAGEAEETKTTLCVTSLEPNYNIYPHIVTGRAKLSVLRKENGRKGSMNTHLAVVNNVPTEVKVKEEDVGGRKEAWS